MPPVAVRVALYALFVVPEARVEEEVIASAGVPAAMVSERVAVAVCWVELESLTATVTEKLPLAVGVPEIMPVLAERLSPAGRLPETMDQA
ncbi:hypothetical protein RBB80_31805 [Tunturiibacter gelidiferens]